MRLFIAVSPGLYGYIREFYVKFGCWCVNLIAVCAIMTSILYFCRGYLKSYVKEEES